MRRHCDRDVPALERIPSRLVPRKQLHTDTLMKCRELATIVFLSSCRIDIVTKGQCFCSGVRMNFCCPRTHGDGIHCYIAQGSKYQNYCICTKCLIIQPFRLPLFTRLYFWKAMNPRCCSVIRFWVCFHGLLSTLIGLACGFR